MAKILETNFNKNDGNEKKIDKDVYLLDRLTEVRDSMTETVNNAHEVSKEQTALLKLVSENDIDKHFEEFCKGLAKQIENNDVALAKLEAKLYLVNTILGQADENETYKSAVVDTLIAFNVFGNE